MATIVLLLIGFGGAFVSGLLGIGGAIVLVPLLRFVPPLLGLEPFAMSVIAGLTIVQVFVASLLAAWSHRKAGHFAWKVAWPMMAATGVSAAVGGLASSRVSDSMLEGLFALLSLVAAVLMLLPAAGDLATEEIPAGFRTDWAVAIAGGVGLLSGMIGAGGAFVLVPLMRTALRLPIRLVIGTSLAVVLVAALMGMVSKAVSGQIAWSEALLLVVGSIAGAPLGSRLSHRMNARTLRRMLAGAIALSAAKMVAELLI